MQHAAVRQVLEELQAGRLDVDAALRELRWTPYEDLGFATLDTHRELRKGVPEVVFGSGKTAQQLVEIIARLRRSAESVLVTRVSAEQAAVLLERLPGAVHHVDARIVEVRDGPRSIPDESCPGVLVISAGTSDLPVAEEAAVTAEALGSRVDRMYDCGVAGLHRLLSRRDRLEQASVFVVVAGMEGALPSVVGGLVRGLVIAVPTSIGYGASFGGIAALLGMLNSCASGVVVVNIDNGFGAGYAAHMVAAGLAAAQAGASTG